MMEESGIKGRFWRYGPLIAWMLMIFFASSDEFSAANTSRLIGPLLRWLFPNMSEETLTLIHLAIRKAAHFAEYGVLALLAARAFSTSSKAWLRSRWIIASFSLVVCYALLDEYRQSFVPTRTPSIWDSLLDTAGGVSALFALTLWRALRKRFDRMNCGAQPN
jgi:VanZ family protein